MRTPLSLGLRVLALAAIVFASFGLIGAAYDALFPLGDLGLNLSLISTTETVLAWLAISILFAMVLAYPIVRSRWAGGRLALSVFLAFYGITTVLSVIEAVVFLRGFLPGEVIVWMLVVHGIAGAIIAPSAVAVLGRWHADAVDEGENQRLVMPVRRWAWRLSVIAVTYVFLYLLFGALVAWSDPAVRDFYAGTEMPPLGTIVGLQFVRALIWVAVVIPVIRMMRGAWWETSLAVGLLFAVLMAALLLTPNPFMPQAVRMTHLVEVASSNFIFGWFVGWLLPRAKVERRAVAHERPVLAPEA